MIVGILLVFWLFISTVIIKMPSFIQNGLEHHPEFICGILGFEELIVPVIAGMIAIVIAKIFVLKNALTFHDIDHEKWFKRTLTLVVFSSALLNLLQYWSKQSICKKTINRDIQFYTAIEVPFDSVQGFPVRTITISIMAIINLIYFYLKKFCRSNTTRKGSSSTQTVLPYNQRVLRGDIPVFEQELALEVPEMSCFVKHTTTVAVQTGNMGLESTKDAQTSQLLAGFSSHKGNKMSVWTTDILEYQINRQMPHERKITNLSNIKTIEVENESEVKQASLKRLQIGNNTSEENICNNKKCNSQNVPHQNANTSKGNKKQLHNSPRAWTVAVQTENISDLKMSTPEDKKNPITEEDINTPIAVILVVLVMLIAAIYTFSMPTSGIGTFVMRFAKTAIMLLLPIYWVLFSAEIFAWLKRKITVLPQSSLNM